MGPEVGIAATTRRWGDQLHRFLLDHGGATVKGRIMSPEQAMESTFDLLLIDDICSYLTPRLVVDLRRQGKGVLGVFAPGDGPDAKRRLLEAGVGDVIDSEASPSEFLDQIQAVSAYTSATPRNIPMGTDRGFCLAITGSPGGVGITEVSVGIASRMAPGSSVLVDLNQKWPSVAQRLGLPVHPNLRTAIDYVLHEPERIDEAVHPSSGFDVVTGLANPEAGGFPPPDLATLMGELALMFRRVVVDLGPADGETSDDLLNRVDAVLVVGLPDPVGLTRLIRSYRRIDAVFRKDEIGVVVNRVRRRAEHAEVVGQLRRSLGEVPIFAMPEDSHITRTARDGALALRGPFARSVKRLAGLFDDVGPA